MSDDMKDFVGYRKNRASLIQQQSMLPDWANSTEMAVFTLNLAIILVGLVVSATISDVTANDGSSMLLSFFGKC